MHKKWAAVILTGILALECTPIMAMSTISALDDSQYLKQGDRFENPWDRKTPRVRIVVKNAYIKRGLTESFYLKLDGATWVDGNGTCIEFEEMQNVDINNFGLKSEGEDKVRVDLKIPSDLKEGDEISFEIPLLIRVLDDEVNLQLIPDERKGMLMSEETVFLGTVSSKKLSWQVNDVPDIDQKGEIADITFKEIRPCAISDSDVSITFELKNDNLAFGEFKYISKDEHPDDIDYVVAADDYVEYGGGYEDRTDDIEIKASKRDDRKITVKFKGEAASQSGTITLKNLPIVNKNGSDHEEDVRLKLTSDLLTNNEKDIVVAHITGKAADSTTQSSQEQTAEGQASAGTPINSEVKQEEQVQENLIGQTSFTVGDSTYVKDGEMCLMDTAPYIEGAGYAMIPMKYTAAALGLDEQEVIYSGDTIWISTKVDGITRNIQLTAGSDLAYINNTPFLMNAPVAVKDGKTYIPMAELASMLGVKKEWHASEKKIIFYNSES